jgi:hypothetical protein
MTKILSASCALGRSYGFSGISSSISLLTAQILWAKDQSKDRKDNFPKDIQLLSAGVKI